MKLWLKQCPKCRGDLYLTEDLFDKYLACLQCGRRVALAEAGELAPAERASTEAKRRSGQEPFAPAA